MDGTIDDCNHNQGGKDNVYKYSFTPWPDETWNFAAEVFNLFGMIGSRVEEDYTEEEFELFRSKLSHHGITLREIERVPYHPPESIL